MKPLLYSIYQDFTNGELWVVTNNVDIHNIQLNLIDCEGTWIRCFHENCRKHDDINLILKLPKK